MRLSIRLRTPFARAAPIAMVRKKTKARTRAPTLYLSAAPVERPVLFNRDFPEPVMGQECSGSDAGPHALTCLGQQSGTHQTFDDACRRFRGNLQGDTKSVDGDKGRASVDDFFENGSDDFGTAGRVTSIYIHKASLRSRVW
jgi:hypothetical protein